MIRLRLALISLTLLLLTSNIVIAQSGRPQRVETYTLAGELNADTPIIEFSIPIRRSETTFLADLQVSDGDSLPTLQLVAPITGRQSQETVLLTSHNGRLDHKIMRYGTYILRVIAVDGADSSFNIHITTTEDPIEADLVGVIDDATPFYTIPISVTRTGRSIEIDLREITAEGELDTKLYLVEDRTNTIIATNDDRDRVNGDKSSYIFFPEAPAGTYRIIATRYNEAKGTTSGEFRLFYNVYDQIPVAQRTTQPRNFSVTAGGLLDSGFPSLPNEAHTPWTIFAYYGGDNDLEAALINDLNEFEIAGGGENVRIIALLDRSASYDESNGDWSGAARIFEIGAAENDRDDHISPQNPNGNNPATIDSRVIAEVGVLQADNTRIANTPDGELLAQFLVWGIRNYPSENYVVALGSHGAGWYGLVTADTSNTIIPIQHVQQALSLALSETDLDRFAFLINDACFMSSVEYYQAIAPYFNYSLASPEIVVNPGHDMTLLVNLMNEDWEDTRFTDIGAQMVAKYINTDILLRPGSDVFFLTSALTDLTGFDAVAVAVEEFATLINERNPVLVGNLLGTARSQTYTYQHFMRSRTSKTSNRMIDLADFMRRVIENRNADEEIIRAAQNVIQALDRSRVYAEGGERVENIVGYYNIYFPERSDDFDITYFDQSPLKEWGRMLRNYYNVVTPTPWQGDSIFHTPTAPTINIISQYPQEAANVSNPTITDVEVIGRNITGVVSVFDRIEADGSVVRYTEEAIFSRELQPDGTIALVTPITSGYWTGSITWDATLPVVTDGVNQYYEMLSITDETASMDARYCPPNRTCEQPEDWELILITFNRADGSLQRVISLSQTNNGAGVIEIIPDSIVETYRHVITTDGQVRPERGNQYIWPDGGLSWMWQPAPDGDYNVGYQVMAFGGTTGYATARFHIEGNEELPQDMLSYYRVRTGFNHPYFRDWTPPPPDFIYVGNSGLIDYSVSPDEQLRTRVYMNYLQLPTLEDTITWGQTEVGLEVLTEPRAILIDGEDALEFEMQFVDDNGLIYTGRAFAVRIKHLPFLTAIVAAEAQSGTDYTQHYDFLKAYFNFVDEGYLLQTATNEASWVNINDVNTFTDIYSLYTPSDWETFINPDDSWRVRSAPSADSAQFFATGTFQLNTHVLGSIGVLSHILIGTVLDDAEHVTVTNTYTLYGQYLTWEAVSYTAIRDGIHLSGRMYTIPIENRTFAAWFETPMLATESGFVEDIETINTLFEPILDGYQIIAAPPVDASIAQAN